MSSALAAPKLALGRADEPLFKESLTLDVESGERIASVHVRKSFYGTPISSIRFVTTRGREETFGTPAVGVQEEINWTVPVGWRLVGLWGSVGSHLQNLGVVIVAC
jgi:hypothetical protein